jgi:AraC-like DNA-binding protein
MNPSDEPDSSGFRTDDISRSPACAGVRCCSVTVEGRPAARADGAPPDPVSPDDVVLASAAAILARAESARLRDSARAVRAVHRELSAHPRADLASAWARIEQAKGMLMTAGPRTESEALAALFGAGAAARRSIIDLAAALIERVLAGDDVAAALATLGRPEPPVVPTDASARATPGSGAAAADAVARATAFIDAHAASDIGIAEIVTAAGLGPRALQQAFRRRLDTTASAYLRRARLAGAHRELLAADPGAQTVAAVAARWHFPHQGRFAGYYRDAYGRSPGSSLREPPEPARVGATGRR